jgi:hypothetical protein
MLDDPARSILACGRPPTSIKIDIEMLFELRYMFQR